MLYADFELVITEPRINKYLSACKNDKRKAMALYRANIRLSAEFFSILALFEVALRNKIDTHYRQTLGKNWLYDSTRPGIGFLTTPGCEKSFRNAQAVIAKLGSNYSDNKAVAEFSFGFWTYQFASKEFIAAGSTLLKAFPNRSAGTNHTLMFKRLKSINWFRNRIAHHEPICFSPSDDVSTAHATAHYHQMLKIVSWMGIDQNSFLFGADRFLQEKIKIDLRYSPSMLKEPSLSFNYFADELSVSAMVKGEYDLILIDIYRHICDV